MDRNELTAVYERLKNTVYRVALTYCGNRHDAEDITQEVFLALFASDKEFSSLEHEKAWAIRVTVNKCKNLLKSFNKSHCTSLDEADKACEAVFESSVHTAINSLPDNYRIVIYLYYIEGYSVREIAKITSSAESAVQIRLFRARKKLGKLLKEDIEL